MLHVGPAGAGIRRKLVFKLVLGLPSVLSGGLTFAILYGHSSLKALEILKPGPSFSRVMDTMERQALARQRHRWANTSRTCEWCWRLA